MAAGASGAYHGVLDRDAPETDEQLCVLLEHRPRRRTIEELADRANDARHDDRLRAVAVRVFTPDKPTEAVEKTMQLTLGVVETSGTTPPI